MPGRPRQPRKGKALVDDARRAFLYECGQAWDEIVRDPLPPDDEPVGMTVEVSRDLIGRVQREMANGKH